MASNLQQSLSATGVVIEFISLGWSILEQDTNSIDTLDSYTASIDSKSVQNSDLLLEIRDTLGTFSCPPAVAKPTGSLDSTITSLVGACTRAADDVLLRMDGARMRRDAGKGESGDGAAIERRSWTDADIPAFTACLQALQHKVETKLLVDLRKSIDNGSLQQLARNDKLDKYAGNALQVLSGTRTAFSAANRNATSSKSSLFNEFTQKEIPNGSSTAENKEKVSNVSYSSHQPNIVNNALLETQATTDKGEILSDFILERLRFVAMKDREEEVATAHDRTFAWLFDPQAQERNLKLKDKSILNWLKQHESTIYWITGKPGSGKSTLMRFMYDHRETKKALRMWAGRERPVLMAAFFFWISGSLEQRSQVGLLRYLLYQLLDQHRALVPFVFPELWTQLWSASTQERIRMEVAWELPQLVAGLKVFLLRVEHNTHVALFIDGLDELDGDHTAMIDLLKDIVKTYGAHVKLCVSSRPWPVFEAAFIDAPNLKLQDLTIEDMAQYVDDKLLKNPGVGRLVRENRNSAHDLAEAVVAKASGVFLWVTLAVRLLLDDLELRRYISLTHMLYQLQTIPSDLDELFRHILFDILPQARLVDASRIFQIIRAREAVCDSTRDQSSASLTLWELSLACEKDDDLAIKAAIQQASGKLILDKCTDMTSRINANCVGFLAVHDKPPSKEDIGLRFAHEEAEDKKLRLPNSRIIYVHRTARDFLFYSGIWDMIVQQRDKTLAKTVEAIDKGHNGKFDSHLAHLRASILHLKLPLSSPQRHRRLNERWPTVILALTHARFISDESAIAQSVQLLDEFNETMNALWLQRGSYEDDNWIRSSFGTYEERNKHKTTRFEQPFISLAVKFGLIHYVQFKLQTGETRIKSGSGGAPLPSFATEYLVHRQMSVYPLSSPALIAMLFSYGADPNFKYKTMAGRDETPWEKVLKSVRQAHRRGWIAPFDFEENKEQMVGDNSQRGVLRWVSIVKMFLERGADTDVVLPKAVKDEEVGARELIRECASYYGSCVMRDVMVMF